MVGCVSRVSPRPAAVLPAARRRRGPRPAPLWPFLPRWRLLPRRPLFAQRGNGVGWCALFRRNYRGAGYGPPFHIPRCTPWRGTRQVGGGWEIVGQVSRGLRRDAARGSARLDAKLGWWLEDAQEPLLSLSYLGLHGLRFPKERGEALVAGDLGV